VIVEGTNQAMNSIGNTLRNGNKIFTVREAVTVIAGQLKSMLRAKDSLPVAKLFRLEVPVEEQPLLPWLAAQPQEDKFYLSGRDEEDPEAAMAGIALSLHHRDSFAFSEIFPRIRRFLAEGLASARFYGGFAFAPGHIDSLWEHFGTARFFVPRFELYRKDRQTYFACNVVLTAENRGVEPDSALADLEQVCFSGCRELTFREKLLSREDFPGYRQWVENLNRVSGDIRDRRYKKVVLARKVVLTFDRKIDPVAVLALLQDLPSRRYHFLFQFHGQQAFVGSSPERLFKRKGRQIASEAVAGTRLRGKAGEDDQRLARELIDSDKEQREHDFVLDSIETGLRPYCITLEADRQKRLLKLKEGQHLVSYFQGRLKEDVTDEMLVAALHPTPAVGGCPLDRALEAIARFEPFKRGWYAGVIGAVGSDSADFAVGLRSALIDENRVSLFSGGGIVEGSEAEAEWQELEGKISNFMSLLKGEA
jgi:menaquinone-specific isochorismate synthase